MTTMPTGRQLPVQSFDLVNRRLGCMVAGSRTVSGTVPETFPPFPCAMIGGRKDWRNWLRFHTA